MNHSIVFFTIVARNYLAQAFVLGESVKKHHAESDFVIFLMDDPNKDFEDEIHRRGFSVLYPEEVAFENYRKLVFKYSIIEACTAVKPSILLYLLKNRSDKVIYLDPDIMCYRSFDEVIELLDLNNIVITPHSLSSVDTNWGHSDQEFLKYGTYNLGFLGVAKSDESIRAMEWWAEKLANHCLKEAPTGIFVDQKWFDLVPSYFNKVAIFKSSAYNIAYWNIHERTLSRTDGILRVIQTGEIVAFIHFSNIDVNNPSKISKWLPPNSSYLSRSDFIELCEEYANILISNDYFKLSCLGYGYATYDNGDPIQQLERSLYRDYFRNNQGLPDPFSAGHGTFWEFSRIMKTGMSSNLPDNSGEHKEVTNERNNTSRNYIVKHIIRGLILQTVKLFGMKKIQHVMTTVTRELNQAQYNIIKLAIKKF
jgi:lipopolysaccharide biosynthesis glycosyltransferase